MCDVPFLRETRWTRQATSSHRPLACPSEATHGDVRALALCVKGSLSPWSPVWKQHVHCRPWCRRDTGIWQNVFRIQTFPLWELSLYRDLQLDLLRMLWDNSPILILYNSVFLMDLKGCKNAFGEGGVLCQKKYEPGNSVKTPQLIQVKHRQQTLAHGRHDIVNFRWGLLGICNDMGKHVTALRERSKVQSYLWFILNYCTYNIYVFV